MWSAVCRTNSGDLGFLAWYALTWERCWSGRMMFEVTNNKTFNYSICSPSACILVKSNWVFGPLRLRESIVFLAINVVSDWSSKIAYTSFSLIRFYVSTKSVLSWSCSCFRGHWFSAAVLVQCKTEASADLLSEPFPLMSPCRAVWWSLPHALLFNFCY